MSELMVMIPKKITVAPIYLKRVELFTIMDHFQYLLPFYKRGMYEEGKDDYIWNTGGLFKNKKSRDANVLFTNINIKKQKAISMGDILENYCLLKNNMINFDSTRRHLLEYAKFFRECSGFKIKVARKHKKRIIKYIRGGGWELHYIDNSGEHCIIRSKDLKYLEEVSI